MTFALSESCLKFRSGLELSIGSVNYLGSPLLYRDHTIEIDEYYSDQTVVKEFRQMLKKRDRKGYYIVESNIGNSFEEIFHYLEKRIHTGIKDT